jgi:hypothetical protein
MEDSTPVLKIAVRVLTAINEKTYPDEADIREIEAIAGTRSPGMSLDEYVCDAIQIALKRRAEERRTQPLTKRASWE